MTPSAFNSVDRYSRSASCSEIRSRRSIFSAIGRRELGISESFIEENAFPAGNAVNYHAQLPIQVQLKATKGRTSCEHPPPQPTTKVSLVVAILRRAPEEQLGWRRRHTGLGYVRGELSIRRRDQANRAFGIVPPAIGVGVFFASLV